MGLSDIIDRVKGQIALQRAVDYTKPRPSPEQPPQQGTEQYEREAGPTREDYNREVVQKRGKKQYKTEAGPQPPTPSTQYRKEAGPTREDYEEDVRSRGKQQYSKPAGPSPFSSMPTEQYKKEANPTRADLQRNRQEQFEIEQAKWNKKEKERAWHEQFEREKKEQAEKDKANRMPTFGQKVGKGAVGVIGGLLKPLGDVRQKNIDKMNKPASSKQLTREEVQKMINRKNQPKKKGGMTQGQFRAPAFGNGGFGGNMGSMDPFAGLGGRSGGMGLGLGKPKKTTKKLKKMDDWFKF